MQAAHEPQVLPDGMQGGLCNCASQCLGQVCMPEQMTSGNAVQERMEEAMRQLVDLEEAESSDVVYIRGRATVHSKPGTSFWRRWVRARALTSHSPWPSLHAAGSMRPQIGSLASSTTGPNSGQGVSAM